MWRRLLASLRHAAKYCRNKTVVIVSVAGIRDRSIDRVYWDRLTAFGADEVPKNSEQPDFTPKLLLTRVFWGLKSFVCIIYFTPASETWWTLIISRKEYIQPFYCKAASEYPLIDVFHTLYWCRAVFHRVRFIRALFTYNNNRCNGVLLCVNAMWMYHHLFIT